jgi:putative CocE/NonD family hydrolase
VLGAVVANGIPAYLVGGWHDIFQRGEPLNYAGLQNAWAGRPVDAPMQPGQRVTGRYQLLMGPWYHAIAPGGMDLEKLQLEWFDTWLRDEPTGMADTPTPLHLQDVRSARVLEAGTWPLPRAVPQRWYLGAGTTGTASSMNDGILGPARPATPGTDPVIFTGASNPCSPSTEQWSGGLGAAELGAVNGPTDPCAEQDHTLEAGPTALTYTSAPFTRPMFLAGPIGATVEATSTTTDSEWVVSVEDVAPDGASVPLTEGALLGSMRTLTPTRTWWTPDGGMLMPFHPLTSESAVPVPPGEPVRYDIEVLPTVAGIAPGHRLRVTLSTSDTPHLLATATQLAHLAGGVYQVLHSPAAASFVELPLAPDGGF